MRNLKGIGFELKGKTAFFKKPDVNAKIYFTYSHIHKIALLGIFGALIGYGGYNEQNRDLLNQGESEDNIFPEFYQKLKDLKISLVPQGDRGYFFKKIQTFNNSVGYASNEAGKNLVVREQWLENPHWTIYVLDNQTEGYQRLSQALLLRQATYLPYLGKNDHPATILNPREVNLTKIDEVTHLDSLFIGSVVQLGRGFKNKRNNYYYKERLPIALEAKLNGYIFEELMFTDRKIERVNNHGDIYLGEEQNLFFC